MSTDNILICFKHCCASSIFCKKVPEACPICNSSLSTFVLEPFVIPYPLVNAKDYPCSIVVRPSLGNFLENYTPKDDLHIGITNSNGIVFEYDKFGIIKNDKLKWTNCVAIECIPESWISQWEEVLSYLCNDSQWNSCNYNEISFNCFNFVLSFLNHLKYTVLR